MSMFNHGNHPWNQGQGHPDWYGFGNQGLHMNQAHHYPPGPPPPPYVPFQNRMNNYNNYMMQAHPGPSWQGPGPSRPRNRSHRGGRGPRHHSVARIIDTNNNKETCCQCGEHLQNSGEPGIHLCSGEHPDEDEIDSNKRGNENGETSEIKEEDLDERLEKLLDNLKDCMRKKYQTVTEALEEYVTEKIGEITSLHRENSEQKETLEKLKSELEAKAASLIKEEKELRDKQRRLTKDQESFKREMKKEKEEVCRKWQELKDEITRMEETHEIQKVA